MARRAKQRRPKSRPRRRDRAASADGVDQLQDVLDYGGDSPSASRPAGAPFGPRVEIADRELRFPDEEPLDLDAET